MNLRDTDVLKKEWHDIAEVPTIRQFFKRCTDVTGCDEDLVKAFCKAGYCIYDSRGVN